MKIRLTENKLKQIVHESIVKVLNENRFKSPLHKMRAAINIAGKREGKTPEEIRQDMLDAEAKLAAIRDINKEYSTNNTGHDLNFINAVKTNTFDTDFTELDYYDPYYDDFTKNNTEMVGPISRFEFSSPITDEYTEPVMSYENPLEVLNRKNW